MGRGDPSKPRGRMSSYAYFVQTCREEHKKKHPNDSVAFTDFSRKCSERWKGLSPKEKLRFEDLARADKTRYDTEMKDYAPARGGRGGPAQRKKKDPNAPKRPPSAFFIFCADFRPQIKADNPGMVIGTIAKRLGEMWGRQTNENKAPYEHKANILKEKYKKDVAAYQRSGASASGAHKPAAAAPKRGKPAATAAAPARHDDDEDEDDEEDEEGDDDDDDDYEDDE
ncbi:high mobility group protein B2-like [Lethenteron reissneri]|uniref:High mobility group protein B2 n=1 Tax=Lethenteron camtschaticum TaxID=980415 RepID=F5BA48_LETCA|nr:high mobility group protein B2-like [Lethenteron reissneri]ADW08807.1 high mobility group box X [Lethenteron camtschaticum]